MGSGLAVYTATQPVSRCKVQRSICICWPRSRAFGRPDPEEGVTKIFRNVAKYSPIDSAPVPAYDVTGNLQLDQISASDDSVRNSSHADIWALKFSGLLECDAVLPKRRYLFTEVRGLISGMFVILIMRRCTSSEMRSTTLIPSFIQIYRQFCRQTDSSLTACILCRSFAVLLSYLSPSLSVRLSSSAAHFTKSQYTLAINVNRSVGLSLQSLLTTIRPVSVSKFAVSAAYCAHSTAIPRSRDSSVGTATRYGLDGPGIESRWEGEIFRTRPDRL
jgi:hypothetical protein